jgi:hypothetical protein
MCKGRTGAGQNVSKAGRETSTTGEQRLNSAGEVGDGLAVVGAAWPAIPPEGRRAILGAVRAFTPPRRTVLRRGLENVEEGAAD